MQSMLKVALVGCGGIGLCHLRAYQKIGKEVKVAVCIDKDLEKARMAAAEYGAEAYADIADMPAGIDAVSVVTPPMNHYEVVKPLLERGAHVFCEKPLTMQAEQARELVAIAKKRERVLMVGFKMRFEPIFVKTREYLPRIGKLHAVSATKLQPFASRGSSDWRSMVGAMYELSVHDFDLVHWITGLQPEKVSAQHLGYQTGWSREDSFSITIKYTQNVIGQFTGLYASKASFFFRDLALTFLGEKGYLRAERPDRIVLHLDKFEIEEVPPDGSNAFVSELTHFCNVIQGKEKNLMDGRYGLWTTQIVEGANVSFREQREITLKELP